MAKANAFLPIKTKEKTQKKQKGKRNIEVEHKTVKIAEIIKLEYIVKMICWCGNELIINSTRPITENVCSSCGSPIKLLEQEWTDQEINMFMTLKGLK